MAKVLVSDPVAAEGVEILRRGGLAVDVKTGLVERAALIAIIGDFDALAVRSETKVTADVLEAATNLKIIGRAGCRCRQYRCRASDAKGHSCRQLAGGKHDRRR